jgi:hypothetical protein
MIKEIVIGDMYRHIRIEGKINGMLYTNECNQSRKDVCFIFPKVIVDVCLIKFWHLYWKE